MSSNSRSVVVVGAGLAGLAAAAELSARGLAVTVVDQNDHAGGKMNVLSERGFTFDMGPTIITLPEVLRGIIRRCAPAGKMEKDYIDLRPCQPQWRCHYEDGERIDLTASVPGMCAELARRFGPETGAGYAAFLDFARRMLRLSEKVFFYRDVGSALDMMRGTRGMDLALLRDVLGMRLHSTVAATAHGMIREPHVRQMVEHFMQYVGSSPFLAPAILSLIAAAQADGGVWYPMGGTRQVAGAVRRLAEERGAKFILGQRVVRIHTGGTRNRGRGRVHGVELADGRRIEAGLVVSNADVQRTLRDLVGLPETRDTQRTIAKRYTPACSGVVLYLGLNRQYEHLAHHNFLFSRDSRREFDDLYTRGVPAEDPSLYVAAPARTDPSQAPRNAEGGPGESLYVLVHTPFVRPGQDWGGESAAEGMLAAYRPIVMDKLRRFGMEGIDRHIVVDRFLHPGMIERWYNAEGGAIYGLASHGRLHGGFKPRNRTSVEGLYLAGGSANPGPGVPMVLMSGVTAARCLLQDLGEELLPLQPVVAGESGVEVEVKPDGLAAVRG
ncbi:MAG: phytoene desaturase family protein [Phycisphaerales bacterium]